MLDETGESRRGLSAVRLKIKIEHFCFHPSRRQYLRRSESVLSGTELGRQIAYSRCHPLIIGTFVHKVLTYYFKT